MERSSVYSLTSSGKPCKKCLKQGKKCIQHQKKVPSKEISSPKKVRFAKSLEKVKKIPALTPKSPKGIYANPVSDLQAECVSSVIEVFGIWDETDLALTRKKLRKDEKALIRSCIKVMERKKISDAEEAAIKKFSSEREERRDVFRRQTIERENRILHSKN